MIVKDRQYLYISDSMCGMVFTWAAVLILIDFQLYL